MTLDEITGTVGSVFLGMTFKCAQCHDHKYVRFPKRISIVWRLSSFRWN